MTCKILTADQAHGFGCVFEEWSREKRDMCSCGKPVIASVGGNPICLEHLPDALMRAGACSMFDTDPVKRGGASDSFRVQRGLPQRVQKSGAQPIDDARKGA